MDSPGSTHDGEEQATFLYEKGRGKQEKPQYLRRMQLKGFLIHTMDFLI